MLFILNNCQLCHIFWYMYVREWLATTIVYDKFSSMEIINLKQHDVACSSTDYMYFPSLFI